MTQYSMWLVVISIIVVIIVIREIACWYWKVNQILSVLNKIEKNTRQKEESSLSNKEDGLLE